METIKTMVVQALTNLEQSSNVELREKNQEVSIYAPSKVSTKCLALNIVKLKSAFPKLSEGWYLILEEMIDVERFSDQRLNDAVMNLIKTSIYPEPTIANLINFDRKYKLYTYEELLKMSDDFSFERKKIFFSNCEIVDKEKKLWRINN